LQSEHQLATLSRGYGRKTRGLRFAKDGDDAATIGDEPYQLFRKFAPSVKVVVGEDRAFAIPNLLNEYPEVDVILLDDAFQHRSVRPLFSIMLSEYDHIFTSDFILPAGNLREARSGASRADVVVITKCPEVISNEVQLVASVRKYAGAKPVFFSTIRHADPVSFGQSRDPGDKVVVVTGIANPDPLVAHIRRSRSVLHHFRFSDHYRFRKSDVDDFVSFANQNDAAIFTTEKDMVRLLSGTCKDIVLRSRFFFVPIEAVFLKNGSEFDELVRRKLKVD
jgi:tetraacyldisaccharide 4'-kinase